MTQITIKKDRASENRLPVFTDIASKMDAVRERAFELFEGRGSTWGSELDDWFAAERDIFGSPAAELKETAGEYQMEVSLPGFAAKEVEVNATPNEVIVHAVTEKRNAGVDETVVWSELGTNDVYRRFAFPEGIDTEKMVAELDNGRLRVKAPKAKRAMKESKNIPVTAA